MYLVMYNNQIKNCLTSLILNIYKYYKYIFLNFRCPNTNYRVGPLSREKCNGKLGLTATPPMFIVGTTFVLKYMIT